MNPLLADLYSAIGMLVVNFGSLEYLTFEYLRAHLSDEEYARASKRHFNERLELCFELVIAKQSTAGTSEVIEGIREKLKPVRELRNHIAHGYLLVRFDLEGKNPVLTVSNPREFEAMYSDDSFHLSPRGIFDAMGELKEVITRIEPLFGFKTETYQIELPP